MHVRRARLERLEQQEVHELDDRRLVGEVHQIIEGDLDTGAIAGFLSPQPGDDSFSSDSLRAVHAPNRGAQLGLRPLHELGLGIEHEPQVIQHLGIDFGQPGGDLDAPRLDSQRQYCVELEIVRRQPIGERSDTSEIESSRMRHGVLSFGWRVESLR